MPGIDLTIDTHLIGTSGIGQGRGRLRSLTFETSIHGRGTPQRTGRYTLTSDTYGDRALHWTPATSAAAALRDAPTPLTVAQ